MRVTRMLWVGIAVLAAIGCFASPANATLICGFEFAGGATSVKVPLSGGDYTVNVYVEGSTGVTDLGLFAGYVGALSEVPAGAPVIEGGVAGPATMPAALGTLGGAVADKNLVPDGHMDLGGRSGADGKTSPPWMRPNAGANAFLGGGSKFYIGSFQVTIPANAGGLVDGAAFLKYNPQVDPTGIGNDWTWSENGTNRGGSFGGTAPNNVVAGTSVTFQATAVPEPSLMLMLAGGAVCFVSMSFVRRKVS